MVRTLLVALCCITLLSACKKEKQSSAIRAVLAGPVVPADPTLHGVLGTGHFIVDTIHLTSAVSWHLSGLVYVDSADVIIIDPGTIIRGDLNANSFAPGGGLIITRGAKIFATGTVTSPIIFTSASVTPDSGDWSGVMIIGNASTNNAARIYPEGVPSNAPVDIYYGGNVGRNDNDNSGSLKYVRIEYAGFVLSTDNEINGLTLCGVGNGTIIDFVEVFKAKDDSFEWFGGTVNASHLLAVDGEDDMFDTDNGYRGTITYALGIADTSRASISTSNGIESDNYYIGTDVVPYTNPIFSYITLVGLPTATKASITNGSPSGSGKYGRAAHLRRNTRFTISKAIAMGFNYGFSRDLQSGSATGNLSNNFVHAFVRPYLTEMNGIITPVAPPAGNDSSKTINPNANILLRNPFRRDTIVNYVPLPISSISIRASGAFPEGNTAWANGWTRLR